MSKSKNILRHHHIHMEQPISSAEHFQYLTPATEYFDTLAQIDVSWPVKHRYKVLSEVLSQAIDQKLTGMKEQFAGLFPKIQYLLRAYVRSKRDDRSLMYAINQVRVRLRCLETLADTALQQSYPADLGAVCRFISLIYDGCPVPQTLLRQIPDEVAQARPSVTHDNKAGVIDALRCSVDGWDDQYIYVTRADDGTQAKVDYATTNPYQKNNWAYLIPLLAKDDVLSLVRSHLEDDVLLPELIIYNPDVLINVTTVAGCFEEYGSSPRLGVISKLKTIPTTEPILLGNFASQLLDEACFQQDLSYRDSAVTFFRRNALSIACCPEVGADFHVEAKQQKRNIQDIISENRIHLTNNKTFSSDHLIVEPSFVCPTLGLQGRMDFIHLDYSTIIEQKSGKGRWPETDGRPRHQTKHYVQLLLYRALFHYAYLEKPNADISTNLFYTKYASGLVYLDAAPELLFEAFKIRNCLAWSEMYFARNGMEMLKKMSAESIFPGEANTLWNRYHKPQIDGLLNEIKSADPLAQAYYFRFIHFLAAEHMLSRIGNHTKENSGFASVWNATIAEKRQAGNIYEQLSIRYQEEEAVQEDVQFCFSKEMDADLSNFRVGDIVMFYPYTLGTEPDATAVLVFRATLTAIHPDGVEVHLRNPQHTQVLKHYRRKDTVWAIEHDFMESSYSSLYKGMQSFLSANEERRDLILNRRKPNVDTSQQLTGDYSTPVSSEFNDLVLYTKQAQDIYLIIGPPGTGKTSYGMLNVLLEHLATPGTSVLLMAYTNRAVDEICSKLVEHNLDFLRLGSAHGCNPIYRPYLMEQKVDALPQVTIASVRRLIADTRIVCGTTTALNAHIALFGLKRFDLAIVDEASQILEPYILPLMSAKHGEENAIGKFVLIGDEKQLPAVVQQDAAESVIMDPLLNAAGLTDCRQSIFERLMNTYGKDNKQCCYMLTRQGRMHPDIAAFPNYAFYNNALKPVPLPHQEAGTPLTASHSNAIANMLQTRRVAFVSYEATKEAEESDKVNQVEAEMIAATVIQGYQMMGDRFDIQRSIGVIVPYRNQISTIRNAIDRQAKALEITCLHDISIDTVERYQGSQRDLIIYGFTVKRYYQLSFLTSNEYYDVNDGAVIDRKLNVAMTRAENNLVMVGNARLLAEDLTFYKLIAYLKSKDSFFEVDPPSYVRGTFDVPSIVSEDNVAFAQRTYQMDAAFAGVFDRLVIKPIQNDADTVWPDLILGNKRDVNMNIIGYGRTHFDQAQSVHTSASEDGARRVFSPYEQALLYGYYLMRERYLRMRVVLDHTASYLEPKIQAMPTRVHLIDVGCGGAPSASAFLHRFASAASIHYVGIDPSDTLRDMGWTFLMAQGYKEKLVRFLSSFDDLSKDFWEAESELPSLFVFDMTGFFATVPPTTAEHLAFAMMRLTRRYPMNRYVWLMDQSAAERDGSEAYRVFRKVLLDPDGKVRIALHASVPYRCEADQSTPTDEICYEVWER